MKSVFINFIVVLALAGAGISCSPKPSTSSDTRFKARFEQSGICANNTYTVIEGKIDTSLVQASWTNPQTNKTYTNAFTVMNPCDMPQGMKEGDEFYFEIDSNRPNRCMVCQAYYPTPAKRLNIKVVK